MGVHNSNIKPATPSSRRIADTMPGQALPFTSPRSQEESLATTSDSFDITVGKVEEMLLQVASVISHPEVALSPAPPETRSDKLRQTIANRDAIHDAGRAGIFEDLQRSLENLLSVATMPSSDDVHTSHRNTRERVDSKSTKAGNGKAAVVPKITLHASADVSANGAVAALAPSTTVVASGTLSMLEDYDENRKQKGQYYDDAKQSLFGATGEPKAEAKAYDNISRGSAQEEERRKYVEMVQLATATAAAAKGKSAATAPAAGDGRSGPSAGLPSRPVSPPAKEIGKETVGANTYDASRDPRRRR